MKPFLNERIVTALKAAERVFLCTHVAPDGDAIGSLLAVRLLLEGMGKTVVACCADPVPGQYMILPGADQVIQPDQAGSGFDTALSLDAADLRRIGSAAGVFERIPIRLQIDHHGTNPCFAQENEIDANAAAAGCIVMRLIKALNQPLTREIAVCLYTAISTDTGNFSYSNADAEAFEIMAVLSGTGFDLASLARHLHLMHEPGFLGLLSRALSRLTFLHDGEATMTSLYPQDYADAHALPEHSDNIVNYGLYIPGVKLTCFVNSQRPDVTKFSFRALPPYSARRIAVRLDGGGHEAAAGATVRLPAEQAIRLALAEIDREMENKA